LPTEQKGRGRKTLQETLRRRDSGTMRLAAFDIDRTRKRKWGGPRRENTPRIEFLRREAVTLAGANELHRVVAMANVRLAKLYPPRTTVILKRGGQRPKALSQSKSGETYELHARWPFGETPFRPRQFEDAVDFMNRKEDV